MLTKSDINQIRVVVHEEVEIIVTDKLKPIKKALRYLKKTVDLIGRNYDKGDVELDKRVSRIELHLALPEEN